MQRKELFDFRWGLVALLMLVLTACGGGGGAGVVNGTTTTAVSAGVIATEVKALTSAEATQIEPIYNSDNAVSGLRITSTQLASQATPGKIFLLPPTDSAPSGIAIKVKTATQSDGVTVITYTQPAVNEVFADLEIRLRKNINPGDVAGVSLASGVKLVSLATSQTQTGIKVLPNQGEGIGLVYQPRLDKVPLDGISTGSWIDVITGSEFQRDNNIFLGQKLGFKIEKLVLADLDGKYLIDDGKRGRGPDGRFIAVKDATTNDQVRLSGEATLDNAAVDFDIKIANHDVTRIGARMNGTLNTKWTLGYQWQGDISLADVTGELKNNIDIGAGKIAGIDYGTERIMLGSINVTVGAVEIKTGNTITKLPIAAIISLSMGEEGKISADVSFGMNYSAYFDKGAYISRKNSNSDFTVEKQYNIFAHGDYPNPNVPGARAATAAEIDRKPFISFGADGSLEAKNTVQIGVDLSVAIFGMIPVQLNNPIIHTDDAMVKGSAWLREAGWDITGCARFSSKTEAKSILYTRIVVSGWPWSSEATLIDKKYDLGSIPFGAEQGLLLTCSVTLTPSLDYEVNPSNLPAPGVGKHVVRFSGDAAWKAVSTLSKDGLAEIDRWEWTFGDTIIGDVANGILGADAQFPIYTYSGNGPYTVKLKVTDKYGQKATIEKTITFPTLNATPQSPTVLESVSFWITNAYQTVKTVLWNFGSNIADQTATVVNSISTSVSQAFTTIGQKTVTATFKDIAGSVLGQEQTTITVLAGAAITGASSDSATQPGSIANNGTTDDATPTLSGTISAPLTSGQKVNVYDRNTLFAATAALTPGGTTWTFTPATPLIGGLHSFTAEVADFQGIPGARSAAYVVNVLSTSVATVSPDAITRTLAGSFAIVGRDLPTSGISVTVPGDSKAVCQAPNNLTTSGFNIACQFYKLGAQTLEVRTATKLLGTVTVTVKTNVTGVTWTSPSTTSSGTVKFGETVAFSVAGVNMLADPTMGFAVQLCGVSNTEMGTPSNTLRTFSCNFNNTAGAVAGQMPGVVKDAPGGQVLFEGWNVAVEVPVAPPVATGRLPDTGITASQCYSAGSNALVSCTSAAAIALNSQQDGMVGRDVANNDDADGKAGFSYTKIGADGRTLPASATAWSCVKDNITGLIWEVKTADGGLRDRTRTYTNYDSTTSLQLGGTSTPTQAQINAASNSVGFKNAVNIAGLCGATDWRLPTADELQSIVDYGVPYPGPTIDAAWFPNTVGNSFWSSSPYVDVASFAWFVSFDYGVVYNFGPGRSGALPVRLVRAGQ